MCYLCDGGEASVWIVLKSAHLTLCEEHNPMVDTKYPVDDAEALKHMLYKNLDDDTFPECDEDRSIRRISMIANYIYDKYNGLCGAPGSVILAGKHLGVDLIDIMREDGYEPERIPVKRLKECEVNPDGFGLNNIEGEYTIRYIKDVVSTDNWTRADVMIYDETGTMELTLWNEMAEAVDEHCGEDDVIDIRGGYVKDGDYGRSLNIAKAGMIELPNGDRVEGPDYDGS
jgi:hypothetical protein